MELTLIVTKVFAVYLIVSGAFLLFKGKTLPLLLKDFFAHPAVVYLTGVILVFLGSILLLRHSSWDASLQTLITVFGWLALLKGIAYIFFPNILADFPVKEMRGWFGLIGVALIATGLCLFNIGY